MPHTLPIAASRRRNPRTPGTWLACAVTCVLLATPGAPARADLLGPADRAASLYRTDVHLDESGTPLLPMSVLERQGEVVVSAPQGLRVLAGVDGPLVLTVPAGRTVRIDGLDTSVGTSEHHVVLAQAAANDLESLRRLRALWQGRGVAVEALGSGTTFSLGNRTLDTRRTLLCLREVFATEGEARDQAMELGRKFAAELTVQSVVGRPPSGTLRVRSGAAEARVADAVWLEADARKSRQSLLLVAGTRNGRKTQLSLPGRVYVVPGPRGGLEVVNEAEVERILQGVVAAEIFRDAPPEAMRAQAVAARTDMLAKLGTRHASDPYALCNQVHCQAYRGVERVSPDIAQAVAATRGVVLIGQDGRLLDAYYHAVSGGHTEHNELVWPGLPQPELRGRADLPPNVADPLQNGATERAVAALIQAPDASWAARAGENAAALRWTVVRTAAELGRSLADQGIAGHVRAIRVLQRGVSGRAVRVALDMDDGKTVALDGELRIRKALGGSAGPAGLRSSLFLVQAGAPGPDGLPREWTFRGAGFGHGVGMCQTGAVGRAKAGQDFREILGHYYGGARLEKLY